MTRSPITTLAGIAGLVLVNAPAIAQNGSFDSGIVGGSIIGGGSFQSSIGGGGTTSGAWGGSGSLGSGPSITRPSITNRHFSTGTAVGGGGGFSLGGQGGGGSGGRRK